jgi:hypothetical protein
VATHPVPVQAREQEHGDASDVEQRARAGQTLEGQVLGPVALHGQVLREIVPVRAFASMRVCVCACVCVCVCVCMWGSQ